MSVVTPAGTHSRSWGQLSGSKLMGQVRCKRDRCHVIAAFPVGHEPPPMMIEFRLTPDEKATLEERRKTADADFDNAVLPDGWVKIYLAGAENDPYLFCSANCAALWLKKQ